MAEYTVQDKLQLDVLKAVSARVTSIDPFKQEILRIFNQDLNISCLKFFDYQVSHYGDSLNVDSKPITLNMPESFWDEGWVSSYYRTFLYNPNHYGVEALLQSEEKDYCIMKITDLMSYDDYEASENYRKVIAPSGYYYSLIVYFRDRGRLISSLTMVRSRAEGDFGKEEIRLLDSVCPYINNRLVEHDRERSNYGYRKLVSDVLDISDKGLIIFDSQLNTIARNEQADFLCRGIASGHEQPLESISQLIARSFKFRNDHFTVRDRDGKSLYFKIHPYYSEDLASGAVAYLVSVSREIDTMDVRKRLDSQDSIDLTERQKQIIEFIAAGKTNKEIADEMYISENTVRKHVENIRNKLGVKNRIAILKELALLAS